MTLFAWTPERVTELRGHFEAGLTATEIMAEMGAPSRNAVLGKLDRMGLKRGHPRPQRTRTSNKPRAPRQAPSGVARSGPVMFRAPLAHAPPIAPTAPAGPPVGILELTNETCRFPMWKDGDPPNLLFCGAREADNANRVVYCPYHSRMAYRRPGERGEGA